MHFPQGGPELQLGRRAFFTSFHTHSSFLTFFCFFVLFIPCSHVRVLRKTLVHKFHVFNGKKKNYIYDFFLKKIYVWFFLIQKYIKKNRFCPKSQDLR